MRSATRSANGVLLCRPGPTTRTNFPKRSTIARSCCSTVMKNKGTSAPLLWTQLVLLNEHRTRTVSTPADPTKFLGLVADARLLGQDMSKLPEAEQRQLPVQSEQGRSMVLHAGVALTAASLIGGCGASFVGGGPVPARPGGRGGWRA